MERNFQWFGAKLTSRNSPNEARLFEFRALTAGELRKWRSLGLDAPSGEKYVLKVATKHPDGADAWEDEYIGTSKTIIDLVVKYSGLGESEYLEQMIKGFDEDPYFTLETIANMVFGVSFEDLDSMPFLYYVKTLHAARKTYEATTGKPIELFFHPMASEQPQSEVPPGYTH